jgi:hypothetical protein
VAAQYGNYDSKEKWCDSKMIFISSSCMYCKNQKRIEADKTSWLIHLSSHREDIIKQLTDETTSCVFCAYSEIFANKKHAASHYRWGHKKSTVINWVLQRMQNISVA